MASSSGHVGQHPQLDLGVVRVHQQVALCTGEELPAAPGPWAVRTGMFCRLGSALEMRPVRVSVWLKVEWIRPSGPMTFSRPSQ